MSLRDVFKKRSWGSLHFKAPLTLEYETKAGKKKEAPPITKTGALATRNGVKSINIKLVDENEKENKLEKLYKEMEKLKNGLDIDPEGKRVISNYIKRFQESKTTKLENVEVVLGKLKRDIDQGRWSIKYGDRMNTHILKGKKDRAAIARFNQAIERQNKELEQRK